MSKSMHVCMSALVQEHVISTFLYLCGTIVITLVALLITVSL